MSMMPRAAAASLIGDHHDDSVPISQDDVSVDDDNKKNDSATPQPPPKKKPKRVEEEPISQYDDYPVDDNKNELTVGDSSDPDDAAAKETFRRWCRFFRPDGRPDGYCNDEAKKRGFQNFKNWLHKEGEDDCPLLNRRRRESNLFYLADLSLKEFESHPDYCYPASFCHISNELLDKFEEISNSHDDFFDHPVYQC